MAEAGLQPLQLSVVQELYVPFAVSQAALTAAQFPPDGPVDKHPAETATPLVTHFVQVSRVVRKSVEGHVPVTEPTLHLRANADAIIRVARAAI
jgi:hypothetical protein